MCWVQSLFILTQSALICFLSCIKPCSLHCPTLKNVLTAAHIHLLLHFFPCHPSSLTCKPAFHHQIFTRRATLLSQRFSFACVQNFPSNQLVQASSSSSIWATPHQLQRRTLSALLLQNAYKKKIAWLSTCVLSLPSNAWPSILLLCQRSFCGSSRPSGF